MSKKFIISIDDVQEFLSTTVGLVWDKKIVSNHSVSHAMVLEDLTLQNGDPVTIRTVDLNGERQLVNIGVTPLSFATYVESFDYSDIDALIEFVVEDDFSDQWINFLAKKYGEEYGSYATGLCEEQRRLIIEESAEKLEEVKLIEKMIWDNHKKGMKNCSDTQNKINSAVQNANNSNLKNK